MASTVGQFLTSRKLEKLIAVNAHAPEKIGQLVHLYIILKEALQGQNIKMTPVKDGIRLSVPHVGKVNVYMGDINTLYEMKLIEAPISPSYWSSKLTPNTFFYNNRCLYLVPQIGLRTKLLGPFAKPKYEVYDEKYILSQVRSAITYLEEKK